jgi:phosphate transport system protein
MQSDNLNPGHILQLFDQELLQLNGELISMGSMLVYQLDDTLQALEDGDLRRAKDVIDRDQEVKRFQNRIDAEVLEILARQWPLATDFRAVISSSKVADELQKIGSELAYVAELVLILFDPETSDPNPKLLRDIFEFANLVQLMLNGILELLKSKNVAQAYSLLGMSQKCETELQDGIKHQLDNILLDARLISRGLDIMRILKSLDQCGEYCRNIAVYMIFMIEGVDIRNEQTREAVNPLQS